MSKLTHVTATPRSFPVLLLAVLTLLSAGAAVLAIMTGPSADQRALQAAFAKTSHLDDFRFKVSVALKGQSLPNSTGRASGVWQSPNRLQLTSRGSTGSESTTTVIGSTLYLRPAGRSGLVLHFKSALASPFFSDNGPIFFLPPLGDVSTAIDISRRGNVFSFVIPSVHISQGWVAYAPESGHAQGIAETAALRVPETVMIKNGFIVAISYPHGVRNNRADLMGPASWRLFDFGGRARVVKPTGTFVGARGGTTLRS